MNKLWLIIAMHMCPLAFHFQQESAPGNSGG